MIASLRRPRVVIVAALTGWLLAVGIALTAANVVPLTHVGTEHVGLPQAFAGAGIRIEPETINVGSGGNGGTVTVFITLWSPHAGSEVVPASVELCYQLRCTSNNGQWNLEGNGTFHSKFDRAALRGILQGVTTSVTLVADGRLTAPPGRFRGSDVVTIHS
jgi:hypothetical protein